MTVEPVNCDKIIPRLRLLCQHIDRDEVVAAVHAVDHRRSVAISKSASELILHVLAQHLLDLSVQRSDLNIVRIRYAPKLHSFPCVCCDRDLHRRQDTNVIVQLRSL